MRKNLPVTHKEYQYNERQRIVSTTNKKAQINHINQDFIDISGFSADELLGQPHNMVRHPDMPPAAFKDMWSHLSVDKPWMGLVKNRCKNGDHYWVDAFVTPMEGDGGDAGFQSVRVKPQRETVQRAERFYQSLNAGHAGLPWHHLRLSLFAKTAFAALVSILTGGLGIVLSGTTLSMGITISLGVMLLLNVGLVFAISRPWSQAAQAAGAIYSNPIAQYIYSGRTDELGQLQLALHFLQSQQNTIIWRSSDATDTLAKSAQEASEVTAATEANMARLYQEVDMVSTAMNEMTATVQEVAQNAAATSNSTQDAYDNVQQGQDVVAKTKSNIARLSSSIDRSSEVIQKLAQDSQAIGSVIDVINGIAEQTNLLALNAAIEAARAGELGRGFAVVADEVRSLAGKTQASTSEISEMILALQSAAKSAVSAMDDSKSAAESSVTEADNAELALSAIRDRVNIINDMSMQIATAAEEQSQVSAEINKNIVNINDSATQTHQGCQRVNSANTDLNTSISKLNQMIVQFTA